MTKTLFNDFGWLGLCVCPLLGAWFLLSVLHQLPGRHFDWVKRRNVYLLIPGWTFFAPNPGASNYRYVFRDVDQTGRQSEWEEITWCGPRTFLHALWHTGRHRTKLIVDCINGLILMVRDLNKRGIDVRENPQTYMVSTPYLALLHIASQMPSRLGAVVGRQFAVIEQIPSEPSEAPRMIVCSPFHDVV